MAPRGISWEPSMSRQVTRTGRAWQALMVTSNTHKNTQKKESIHFHMVRSGISQGLALAERVLL